MLHWRGVLHSCPSEWGALQHQLQGAAWRRGLDIHTRPDLEDYEHWPEDFVYSGAGCEEGDLAKGDRRDALWPHLPRKVNFTSSPMSSLLFHRGWLTIAQRLVFLWTRDHRLSGPCLRTLEMLVKFCLQFYFKMYFDIKVHHMIVDAPYHVLTSLRILKTVPKNVKDIFTFYVKTGA